MTAVTIHHRTRYRYRETVTFGPHWLMLRPRESRGLRVRDVIVTISPEARLDWGEDVWGNAVATATIGTPSDALLIDSRLSVDLEAEAWPVFPIAPEAHRYPFRYADTDWTDMGALTVPAHPDPQGRLQGWARGFVAGKGEGTDTLSLLQDLNAGVAGATAYRWREEEGTQSPLETLRLASGTCRDLSVLFVEALRQLGFGARLVSGYLLPEEGGAPGAVGTGATHAWGEVFLSGAGWIAFDPTNRSMGGRNLIPVAVGRDIGRVVPVSGGFSGARDALVELSVEVDVIRE